MNASLEGPAARTRSAQPVVSLDRRVATPYPELRDILTAAHGLRLADVRALRSGERLQCVVLLHDATLLRALLKSDAWYAREALEAVAVVELYLSGDGDGDAATLCGQFRNINVCEDCKPFPLHGWHDGAWRLVTSIRSPTPDVRIGWNGAFVLLHDIPDDAIVACE